MSARYMALMVLAAGIFTACQGDVVPTAGQQPVEEEGEPGEPLTSAQEAPADDSGRISPTERSHTPSPDGLTRVVVDGDPSDWEPYPALIGDPAGDSTGQVDVTYVHAFANDTYLYLMFEVAGEVGSYVQIDVDVNPRGPGGWPPDYMVNASPYENSSPNLARIENEQFFQMGSHGYAAQGEAVEMRIPLDAFKGPAPESISFRVMDGICCEADWVAVDTTDPVRILQVDEGEPSLVMLADLTGPASAFCRDAALLRSDSFAAAEAITVPDGFNAAYFIPPSGVNVPSDVIVTPEGEILVASSRAGVVQRIEPDGSISVYAPLSAYTMDQDAAGNIFTYNSAGGAVRRVIPGGSQIIARMPQTACESTIAAAPDGTLYVGFNACSGDTIGASSIFRIPPGGGTPVELPVNLGSGMVMALDVSANGTLFAVLGDSLETVDPDTGAREHIATLPARSSFHGLVVADDGVAYVSTGDFYTSGDLYRVTIDGNVDKIASFENNGLEGLAIAPDGSVIGTQRTIGGVQAVRPDGSVRTLVKPNGLVSPQALAVSPCGELVTVNDEAGRLTLATPDGHNTPFTQVISFQPPQTFVAFGPEGWYVVAEAAPGFPSQVNRYLPSGLFETLAADIPDVSGVAVAPDGSVYVSSTLDGTIIQMLPDGSRQTFASALRSPLGLALASDGMLYAVTGGQASGSVFAVPDRGDAVVAITPDGEAQTLVANLPDASGLAVGPDGLLYVAAENYVYRFTPGGDMERFASGFASARGVAFDMAGNLLVADDGANDVVMIDGFPQGTLRGLVTDSAGTPLEGIYVRAALVQPPYTGQLAMTDAEGRVSLPAAPGDYLVTAYSDNYEKGSGTVTITADMVGEVEIRLEPSE
jgi:sugar lactone lactonase YvrE